MGAGDIFCFDGVGSGDGIGSFVGVVCWGGCIDAVNKAFEEWTK